MMRIENGIPRRANVQPSRFRGLTFADLGNDVSITGSPVQLKRLFELAVRGAIAESHWQDHRDLWVMCQNWLSSTES